jgi:hypothetical protein
MENIIIIALITTVSFAFFKFIEMKFIEKNREVKPLKYFVRDSIIVFVSSVIAAFVFFNMDGSVTEFMHTITETKILSAGPAQVFTDDPGF